MATPDPTDAPDWDKIETEYRHGPLTIRAIAQEGGVSEGAIRKRAKAGGWIRNEPATIRRMAVEKANALAVLPHLAEAVPERLDAIAERSASVLVRHRDTAAALTNLLHKMHQQLDHATDEEPQLSEALTEYYELKAASNPLMAGSYRQQLQNALHAIGLNTRAKTMLYVVQAADKLVGIERKAWNLDADTDQRSYEDLLAEVHQNAMENAAQAA